LEKARYLSELGPSSKIAYLTVNPYLIPKVSGVWSDLPFVDTFWESITKRQFEKLWKELIKPERTRVLIDSEASITNGDPLPGVAVNAEYSVPKLIQAPRQFFAWLREELQQHYVKVREIHGWEEWHRKPPRNIP
jgi:hypothetical protein